MDCAPGEPTAEGESVRPADFGEHALRLPEGDAIAAAAPPLLGATRSAPGAAHRRILAFAWGAWCTGFYSLMLLSFVLQPIQDEFGLSEGRAGAGSPRVGVGMTGVGGLLFGWMSDRLGRRPRWPCRSPPSRSATPLCGLAPGAAWLLAGARPRRPRHRRHLGRRAGDARRDLPARPARPLRRHRPERRAGGAGAGGDRRLVPGAGGRLAHGLPALGAAGRRSSSPGAACRSPTSGWSTGGACARAARRRRAGAQPAADPGAARRRRPGRPLHPRLRADRAQHVGLLVRGRLAAALPAEAARPLDLRLRLVDAHLRRRLARSAT